MFCGVFVFLLVVVVSGFAVSQLLRWFEWVVVFLVWFVCGVAGWLHKLSQAAPCGLVGTKQTRLLCKILSIPPL